MTTQYSPILKLALPVQGELSGTWGDVVNDNITSMVEQAIAGRAVINSWSTNSHTLTSANGTTSESRCAMLELTDTSTALSGAGTVVCPTASKIYIVKNAAGQNITVKTASGTGILVPNGRTTFLFCDGTNVVEALTHTTSLQLGTSTTVTAVLDEDNMASNSATSLATQQSIKAYVDAQVGTVDTLAEVLGNGNTTGGTNIVVSANDVISLDDGTNALPSLTTTGDLNTGIYFPAADEVGITTGGTQRVKVDSAGVDVTGTLDVTGVATAASVVVDNITIDGNTISTTDTNGNLIITPNGTGNVNINSDTLAVSGAEGESAALVLNADEADDNPDTWRIASNTGNTLTIENQISGSAVSHLTITPNATVVNSTFAVAGGLTTGGTVTASTGGSSTPSFTFSGDTNTGMFKSANDTIGFTTGGTERVQIGSFGVAADTLTNKTSSTSVTIDSAVDITLDADSGNWRFKDDGTSILEISRDSNTSVTLFSAVADMDILFKGSDSDGGGTITALTLDMSNAGAATFNSSVTTSGPIQALAGNDLRAFSSDDSVFLSIKHNEIDLSSGDLTLDVAGDIILDAEDNGKIQLHDGGAFYGLLRRDTNDFQLYSIVQDGAMVFRGNDGGANVTALTLAMADAGKATFNNAVLVSGQILAHQTNKGVFEYNSNVTKIHSYGASSGTGQIQFLTGGGGGSADSLAMAIDNNQKLLIGNSSSQTTDLLQVESPASGGGHGIAIRRNDNNTDQQLGRIMFGNTVDSDIGQIHVKTTGATNTGAMIFSTASSGTTSETLRLSSAGDVELIQSNNLYWKHQGGGTIRAGISADSSDNLTFSTGSSDTTRMTLDGSGNVSIANGDLTITSTDAGASINPVLTLDRNSSSPLADDQLARIEAVGRNDAGESIDYVRLVNVIRDPADGSESGRFAINTMSSGTQISRINVEPAAGSASAETVFNDESYDVDFRVETNNSSATFFVDGEYDGVGIHTTSPVSFANAQAVLFIEDTVNPSICISDTGQTNDYYIVANGSRLGFIYGVGSNTGGTVSQVDMLSLDNSSGAVFNDGGADRDFRVEASEPYAFFIHGGDSSVQMGGASAQTVGTLAPGRLLLLNDNNSHPALNLFRQDTSIGAGGNLGEIVAYSNDTADNDIMPVCKIEFAADGAFGSTDNPSKIGFFTTPNNSETIREAVRIDNVGNLKMMLAGKGIDFSSSQTGTSASGATTSSEVLDHYEEGLFAPTYVGTSTSISVTLDSQVGFYTRIGDTVFFRIHLGSDAVSGGSSSNLQINGLPFATASGRNFSGPVGLNYAWGSNSPLYWYADANTSVLFLYKAGGTNITTNDLATGANSNRLWIQGQYKV